ncbi:mitogen-activated protein kinase kinase kinase 17-like [Silene latifolia]|uniref:mitogen-activated protein kinase kinase kinase 17-like n=1 Tax=Silene latifolia TaxID=37657 RepID=UPI003D76F12B
MTSGFLPCEWGKGKLIGSGSFGQVYIAINKNNGQLFVVKSSHCEVGMKSLEKEVLILSKLKNSPYIVQFIGKEITYAPPNNERILNVFMEYMGGGTLFDVIDKFGGNLFEGVIRSYTRQLLLGLDYLHKNGIVHCDIKCKNILLDSQGNVKLADFGCATFGNDFLDKSTSSKVLQQNQYVGGTPLWMAPEVLKGESPNKGSDIWSLGCTIIEMATGKPPNWGENKSNPMATILKIVTSNENPIFPNELSREGLNFLEICFQRDSEKRLIAEELLQHPFIVTDSTINKKLLNARDVPSPSSVLDVRNFDMNFSDNEEEDEETQHKGVHNVIPSNIGLISKTRKVMINNFQANSLKPHIDLEVSEKWVTVRSID